MAGAAGSVGVASTVVLVGAGLTAASADGALLTARRVFVADSPVMASVAAAVGSTAVEADSMAEVGFMEVAVADSTVAEVDMAVADTGNRGTTP